MRYEPAIDLDAIDAIDMHTHVEADDHGHFSLDQELMDASAAYFKSGQPRTPTIDDIAEHYRARRMAAVVFTVDASTATGHPALSSEEIADGAARHNDVLFHTGQTGIGAGLPGGRGIKLRLSDPMLLDDVAADFPELRIVMAHPGVPWADAAISVATHKANVFMDLSGWLPKYFPPQLVRQLSTLLRTKVLFGSDFPVITPDRWMESFAELQVKDDAKPLIYKENAAHLLGLT